MWDDSERGDFFDDDDYSSNDVKDDIDEALCGEGGIAASSTETAAGSLLPDGSAAEVGQLTSLLNRAFSLGSSQMALWNNPPLGYGTRGGNNIYSRTDVGVTINARASYLRPWRQHFYLSNGTHNRTNIFPARAFVSEPDNFAFAVTPYLGQGTSFEQRVARQSSLYNDFAARRGYLSLPQEMEMFVSIPDKEGNVGSIRMQFSILITAIVYAATACAKSPNEFDHQQNATRIAIHASDDETPLSTIAVNLQNHIGKEIRVKGYLADFSPAVILVKNSDGNVFADPAIVIADWQLRETVFRGNKFLDESEYLASIRCRDRYVEIVGMIGFLEAQKAYGISKLHRIVVFEDSRFRGNGQQCFPVRQTDQ